VKSCKALALLLSSAIAGAWLVPPVAQAGNILTQGQLNAELGTSCAAQGKAPPCITPAQMSDLVVTAVPGVSTGIAASGSSQGTATALTGQMSTITMVPAGSGVVLPAPVAGQILYVTNQGTNPLTVYPPSGTSIDGLAANTPIAVAVGSTAELVATSATAISTVP
jgi:hypothetical protein